MNLAEIRKKAQKADNGNGHEAPAASVPVATAPAPAAPAPEPAAAAPAPEPAAPAEPEPPLAEAFAAFAAEFPAPEFDEPAAELPQTPWRSEPAATLPDEEDETDDPDEFDPAAVILKGRESASFEEDALQQDEVSVASVELLCFKVASEEYAISIMDIKEIIKPREVTEVPRVPSFVRGILSLRGNIIPIFDMRVRLGLDGGGAGELERVVVVKREGGFAGVLVDEVVQVVRIPEGGIEPPPVVLEGIDREFVLGIGRVSGRMLILLDIEKVLDVGLL